MMSARARARAGGVHAAGRAAHGAHPRPKASTIPSRRIVSTARDAITRRAGRWTADERDGPRLSSTPSARAGNGFASCAPLPNDPGSPPEGMVSGGFTTSSATVVTAAAAAAAATAPKARRPSVRGPSSTGSGMRTAPYGSGRQRPRSRSRQASQSPPNVAIAQPFHRTPSRRGYPKCSGCAAQYRISTSFRTASPMPQPRGRSRDAMCRRRFQKSAT